MPFKILEHDTGFLLLAEVYNPSSSSLNQNSYYPYGGNPYYYDPYWSSYSPRRIYGPPPSGYGSNMRTDNEAIKTYESFLVSLNEKGTTNWDYSFPLDNIKNAMVDQVADFTLVNNDIYYVYKKESDLNIKRIPLRSEEEPTESTAKIKLMHEFDELRSEDEHDGAIRYWFNDAFYVWGFQTIRNKTKDDQTRRVFYINKVVAH
jgi:hypothetical protein